jgi:DNA ligase (NAD+)
MINNSKDIRTFINKLNQATEAYDKGEPYLTDMEWDIMYGKLEKLEKETNLIYPDSPTQSIHYSVVNKLRKVTHNHPMLSLQKTKDIEEIKTFLNNKEWIAMAKMDGLTCSLRYVNGELVSAETRGNGIIGEDITHNAMVIPSIPKHIPIKTKEVIVDGEIICTYKNFEAFKGSYKNPRNFASGSIRLLDSKECEKRNLTFVAWDIVEPKAVFLTNTLTTLMFWKFLTVPFLNDEYFNKHNYDYENVINDIKSMCEEESYPIDGIVFKYDNIAEYEAAGRTDHHFKGGIAYKFYDDEYETEVKDIEWTMGRTGQLTPVLIYNDIDIDGTICNRASLHNISVMKNIMKGAFSGQRVYIYKANQIIPQVAYVQINKPDNVPLIPIPEVCPYCGSPTEIRKDYDSEVLYCTNPACSGKLINRLDHFCGKKGLDIKGLSKKTLEKLIDWGWINSLEDIFKLQEHRNEWIEKDGFGMASVDKILTAIEESKNCTASKFIAAIGIPQIGKVASEDLIKVYHTYNGFRHAVDFPDEDDRLYNIKGIGEVMIKTLTTFNYTEADSIFDNYIVEIISSVPDTEEKEIKPLQNKIFVLTGKTQSFKNRNELKTFIESNGGKVTGSISKKTNYLVNNDINSSSTKNKEAKEKGVKIINEEELLSIVNNF